MLYEDFKKKAMITVPTSLTLAESIARRGLNEDHENDSWWSGIIDIGSDLLEGIGDVYGDVTDFVGDVIYDNTTYLGDFQEDILHMPGQAGVAAGLGLIGQVLGIGFGLGDPATEEGRMNVISALMQDLDGDGQADLFNDPDRMIEFYENMPDLGTIQDLDELASMQWWFGDDYYHTEESFFEKYAILGEMIEDAGQYFQELLNAGFDFDTVLSLVASGFSIILEELVIEEGILKFGLGFVLAGIIWAGAAAAGVTVGMTFMAMVKLIGGIALVAGGVALGLWELLMQLGQLTTGEQDIWNWLTGQDPPLVQAPERDLRGEGWVQLIDPSDPTNPEKRIWLYFGPGNAPEDINPLLEYFMDAVRNGDTHVYNDSTGENEFNLGFYDTLIQYLGESGNPGLVCFPPYGPSGMQSPNGYSYLGRPPYVRYNDDGRPIGLDPAANTLGVRPNPSWLSQGWLPPGWGFDDNGNPDYGTWTGNWTQETFEMEDGQTFGGWYNGDNVNMVWNGSEWILVESMPGGYVPLGEYDGSVPFEEWLQDYIDDNVPDVKPIDDFYIQKYKPGRSLPPDRVIKYLPQPQGDDYIPRQPGGRGFAPNISLGRGR